MKSLDAEVRRLNAISKMLLEMVARTKVLAEEMVKRMAFVRQSLVIERSKSMTKKTPFERTTFRNKNQINSLSPRNPGRIPSARTQNIGKQRKSY